MIQKVGKILNEEGEWVEYVEEEEADKPPIAYTYMGGEHCPIEPESEVVDFCMQYRIPKIESLEQCKTLKVSQYKIMIFIFNFILGPETAEKLDQENRKYRALYRAGRIRAI